MKTAWVTVVETKAFSSRAKGRMSSEEVSSVIEMLAINPLCGDLIEGTGGVRKVRFAVSDWASRDTAVDLGVSVAFSSGGVETHRYGIEGGYVMARPWEARRSEGDLLLPQPHDARVLAVRLLEERAGEPFEGDTKQDGRVGEGAR